MKYLPLALCTLLLPACSQGTNQETELRTSRDTLSYSLGRSVGMRLQRDSISIVPEAFLRGVIDVSSDSSAQLLTEAQIQQVLGAFQESLRQKQMESAMREGEKHKREGEAFLAENSKKQGVVTLPSGLQYRILQQGKGKKPTAQSVVTTHYSGKLIDGTEFDNSYKRGEPASFPVNGVISGWTEALQLMPEGSKWELFIPASLGYGEQGAGGAIPPNATLIFQVELLAIQ